MLRNGGFESGLMCYNTSIWSNSAQDFAGDYRFYLSPDSHSGANSLEIRCTGPDCLKAAIISDRIQTPPNQSYKISLYTKCESGRQAALYVPWTAGGDTFQSLTCNGDWARNQVSFTTGTGPDFYFYVYNRDTSYVRVDDITLTYADGSVPQTPVLHPGVRNTAVSGQKLMVDGNPYLGLGFFDVGYDDLATAASLGANTIQSYQLNMAASCFRSWREDYLDRAYELGLNFVPNSVTTARLAAPAAYSKAVPDFAPHLANILWFLADEPDQSGVPYWYMQPSDLIAAYQAIKPLTSLPVMPDFQRAAWSSIGDVQPYAAAADIWMAEPYGADFSNVGHAVAMFNTLARRPIWLAQDDIDPALIVPKAYWAITQGVTGIIYFNWDHFKAQPAKLAAASQAFQELKQLQGAIFAASAPVTATPGVSLMPRVWNGSTYILAAHSTSDTNAASFQVDGLAAGTPVTVLFEGRTLTAAAGSFQDTFYGVSRHVYVIPPAAAAPVTLLPATPTTSTASAAGGWFGSYAKRRKITLDHTRLPSTLANFPVLISWSNADLKPAASGGAIASASGTDIAFTAADGVTRLDYELERYDAASGSVDAWIRIPVLDAAADTGLYVYYGSSSAADQQNKTGVWDAGYRVVNHFSTATAADSTQYGNAAAAAGGAALTSQGAVGPGFAVNGGAGQSLTIPYSPSWNGAFTGYTLEFWVKPGGVADYAGYLALGSWGTTANVWSYADGYTIFRWDTAGGYCGLNGHVPFDGAFHHIALTLDGSRGIVYVDGVQQSTMACSGAVAPPPVPLTIGRFPGSRGVNSVFDELRISAGVARSADWIRTGYTNQKTPAAFYTIAAAEGGSAPAAPAPVMAAVTVASTPAGKVLTVDGAACTAPCTFAWQAGTAHTLAAASPQGTDAFASWSDGGAAAHTVTAPSAAATYTAVFTAIPAAAPAAGPWYGNWAARRKVTMDHTKVSAGLSGFPVAVTITAADLKTVANGGKVGDASEFVFTAGDAVTKLNHEVEWYDGAAGTLVAWVQVPALSASADTSVYVYYGSSSAGDQQNKAGVWDAGYRVVNHFSTATAADSTQYGNAATAAGGAALTSQGAVGPGFAVNGGAGQSLTIAYSPSWNGAFTGYTLEFWVKPGGVADYAGYLALGSWGTTANVWSYADGYTIFRWDTVGGYCGLNGHVPFDGAFHHIALTLDGSRGIVYVDGVQQSTMACSGAVAPPPVPLTIGRFPGSRGVNSVFDELRISAGVARSADWIRTGYTNQKAPAAFYTVAGAEAK